jgi:hypothetical protein
VLISTASVSSERYLDRFGPPTEGNNPSVADEFCAIDMCCEAAILVKCTNIVKRTNLVMEPREGRPFIGLESSRKQRNNLISH